MPLAQALMKVSYDIANEDDLLGKSDDDEQIPPYQVPRKPKQPKQQRQSRDRRPQRSTSQPRTEQYRKRRRHSPSTENRKRSHSLSAEDNISQAEGGCDQSFNVFNVFNVSNVKWASPKNGTA